MTEPMEKPGLGQKTLNWLSKPMYEDSRATYAAGNVGGIARKGKYALDSGRPQPDWHTRGDAYNDVRKDGAWKGCLVTAPTVLFAFGIVVLAGGDTWGAVLVVLGLGGLLAAVGYLLWRRGRKRKRAEREAAGEDDEFDDAVVRPSRFGSADPLTEEAAEVCAAAAAERATLEVPKPLWSAGPPNPTAAPRLSFNEGSSNVEERRSSNAEERHPIVTGEAHVPPSNPGSRDIRDALKAAAGAFRARADGGLLGTEALEDVLMAGGLSRVTAELAADDAEDRRITLDWRGVAGVLADSRGWSAEQVAEAVALPRGAAAPAAAPPVSPSSPVKEEREKSGAAPPAALPTAPTQDTDSPRVALPAAAPAAATVPGGDADLPSSAEVPPAAPAAGEAPNSAEPPPAAPPADELQRAAPPAAAPAADLAAAAPPGGEVHSPSSAPLPLSAATPATPELLPPQLHLPAAAAAAPAAAAAHAPPSKASPTGTDPPGPAPAPAPAADTTASPVRLEHDISLDLGSHPEDPAPQDSVPATGADPEGGIVPHTYNINTQITPAETTTPLEPTHAGASAPVAQADAAMSESDESL
eukprot:Hpha_TRINITY_DN16751_c1_g1::TRINITY_DN16751_c1_g1_i1::g.79259::m.79259